MDLLNESYRLGYDYGYYDGFCEVNSIKPSRRHKKETEHIDNVAEFNRGYEIGKKEGIKMKDSK